MTPDERVQAVTALGFTARHAGFLVTVMLHGGVCLPRQYCTYAGIARGQVVHDFFKALLARKVVTAYPRAHGSSPIYHVHSKRCYGAIGEVDNRNRRPTPLPRALARIMLLDAVLARPEVTWLGTEREKVTHFTQTTRLLPTELPSRRYGHEGASTVRYFPDKLPIGRDPDGQTHIFLYVVTERVPVEFRAFLQRHAELFRMLPAWRVRLLVPRPLAGSIPTYEAALRDELATPLETDSLNELRWYFQQRRHGWSPDTLAVDARLRQAHQAFATPRFRVLFRAWLQRGDEALWATVSPVLADAIAERRGSLECQVLPGPYPHLETMVGTA